MYFTDSENFKFLLALAEKFQKCCRIFVYFVSVWYLANYGSEKIAESKKRVGRHEKSGKKIAFGNYNFLSIDQLLFFHHQFCTNSLKEAKSSAN